MLISNKEGMLDVLFHWCGREYGCSQGRGAEGSVDAEALFHPTSEISIENVDHNLDFLMEFAHYQGDIQVG
jgi:hypothetical protein